VTTAGWCVRSTDRHRTDAPHSHKEARCDPPLWPMQASVIRPAWHLVLVRSRRLIGAREHERIRPGLYLIVAAGRDAAGGACAPSGGCGSPPLKPSRPSDRGQIPSSRGARLTPRDRTDHGRSEHRRGTRVARRLLLSRGLRKSRPGRVPHCRNGSNRRSEPSDYALWPAAGCSRRVRSRGDGGARFRADGRARSRAPAADAGRLVDVKESPHVRRGMDSGASSAKR
jgi:hypothetical protein